MRTQTPSRLGAALLLLGGLLVAPASVAAPDPPLALKAGKADSPYHALAIELVAALSHPAGDAPAISVEESQGSVQNVIDAAQDPAPRLFTAPPNVISDARRGNKPYGKNPRYA